MLRSVWWSAILSLASACATTTSGAAPHDMSSARHEREADNQAATAERHAAQYDPNATTERERCRLRREGGARIATDFVDICWTSVTNPTDAHLHQAEDHRRQASDHRAASAALRTAEAQACATLTPDDRDISPFEHVEDIASVEPLSEGGGAAVVTFRPVPGMTAEALQRAIDCHLARNASLGHLVPEMPDCPLVPKGAQAKATANGSEVTVTIRSDDPATAREILARAMRLRTAAEAAAEPRGR